MLELDSMLFGDRPGRAFRSPDDTDRRGSSEGEAVDLTADVGFHIQRAISYCPESGSTHSIARSSIRQCRFANVGLGARRCYFQVGFDFWSLSSAEYVAAMGTMVQSHAQK
jgi:hypothetical protein